MRPHRFHRRGYTLLTILTLLMVLGAFTVIATRAFMTTMSVNRGAAKAHTEAVRFESAIRLMRTDVWNAAAMSEHDHRVDLKSFDGQTITWTVDPSGTIVRSWQERGKARTQRWEMHIPGITLAVRGPEVIVRVPEGPYTRQSERHLNNQRRVAEGLAS
jgi:hypothetical protein